MSTAATHHAGGEHRPAEPRVASSATQWRYALMNLGMVIPAQLSSFFLLYYVDHLKVDPVAFSTLLTVFAFYNAFDNPLIGHLSDRTRTRWGRRIPYVMFASAPSLVALGLLYSSPFNGLSNQTATLIWFGVCWWVWETAGTAMGAGYLALLPEMFTRFTERTHVATRMNVVQIVGLLLSLALPPVLAQILGWSPMAWLWVAIGLVAIYANIRALYEQPLSTQDKPPSFVSSLRSTFTNRSFLTVVAAQTLRFVATGALSAGMGFYVKYTLGIDNGLVTTLLLAGAFITAGLTLWPWQKFVADRFGARATLIAAFAVAAVCAAALWFAHGLVGAVLATVGMGVGLAGMILMGDVVMADVIDEDEVRTGSRRAGAFFGLGGLITTLSGAVVSSAFGLVSVRYGYNPKLDVQPDTVGTGFRVFMSVLPMATCLLGVVLLLSYPLHGRRLAEIRERLAALRTTSGTDDATGPDATITH